MSSNNSYIQITRANYEEAFLLYTDGELNEEGMSAVEAFVLLHPHLQEELDLLLSTKLHADVFIMDNKETLRAQNLKAAFTDEDLLLYLDAELSPATNKTVEKRLAADKEYKQEYRLLLKTKLAADESIIYPDKTELYRRREKYATAGLWLRIAAAIIILLGTGVLWTSIDKGKRSETGIVQVPLKQTQQQNSSLKKFKSPEQATGIIAMPKAIKIKDDKADFVKQVNKKETVALKSGIATAARDSVTALHRAVTNRITLPKVNAIDIVAAPQQTVNNQAVTIGTTPAYNTIHDAAITETMVSDAVATSNEDKKGSVRGFLRKASRFIERRTGINPVNENDELVIGVVALKLK